MAVCPSCKQKITLVNVHPMNGVTVPVPDAGPEWPDVWSCLSYLCPSCEAVLGVAPNPYAVIDEIMRRLNARSSN